MEFIYFTNNFKQDGLCINNEIIIWESILKWACGQQPVMQQDIDKWNKKED
ncbi:hypothetical protein C1645_822731 [Glomus cerebriforme]|uniref:BACK domain-containing protein n=1 Tax=Glomus cerebriforme TaxID=658196 RepID=A0A397T724_9GLOM|nr:hypothetical protein C1645_822731 [Glomus cerebriforme]